MWICGFFVGVKNGIQNENVNGWFPDKSTFPVLQKREICGIVPAVVCCFFFCLLFLFVLFFFIFLKEKKEKRLVEENNHNSFTTIHLIVPFPYFGNYPNITRIIKGICSFPCHKRLFNHGNADNPFFQQCLNLLVMSSRLLSSFLYYPCREIY